MVTRGEGELAAADDDVSQRLATLVGAKPCEQPEDLDAHLWLAVEAAARVRDVDRVRAIIDVIDPPKGPSSRTTSLPFARG